MPISFNQALFLVLTIAGVVVLVFLALFLAQLRRTAREAERTMVKANEMLEEVKVLERKIEAGVDDALVVLGNARKVTSVVSEAVLLLSTRVVKPAMKFGPIVFPLLQLGVRGLLGRRRKKT